MSFLGSIPQFILVWKWTIISLPAINLRLLSHRTMFLYGNLELINIYILFLNHIRNRAHFYFFSPVPNILATVSVFSFSPNYYFSCQVNLKLSLNRRAFSVSPPFWICHFFLLDEVCLVLIRTAFLYSFR